MVDLVSLFLTAVVFLVPGILFSFGFFSGTKFNKLDKFFAGIILGIIIVPLLSFLEQLVFGVGFTVFLVLANQLCIMNLMAKGQRRMRGWHVKC